ncbi:hypothetical protein GCM10028824_06880 [Hymenobacter segetis]|uniref:tRNA (5-methylaminomethyl-2-thiouridylate)-methyltransferase n=1 Tax=Hymenobacter segetis TaxID=2025509 RepID=A0ABU9M1B2_9BACT
MLPSANFPYAGPAARPATTPAHTVVRVLTLTYGVVPIVAGLDKFTNLLTNWEAYLAPGLVKMLPVSAHSFMMLVGIIEIVAGALVLLRPHLGARVVMAWLTAIALTLLGSGRYLDVAVRDLVMAVGAWALAHLSSPRQPQA